ncbi:MAG: hypothetical protein GF405_03345 [Candidatus Eisenbacteria bacterium]|nr:hypothetical protein [Candidatus Eisenbacteria bacterium]
MRACRVLRLRQQDSGRSGRRAGARPVGERRSPVSPSVPRPLGVVPAGAETGLVIFVPQAETLVQPYRERHDPVAALGMPAHVTVFYPFFEPDEIDGEVLAALERIAQDHDAFSFSLTGVERFPGVLFMTPEPREPFERLSQATATAFPTLSMYEGEHRTFVPHLTVAHADDKRKLDTIAGRFTREAEPHLPINAYAGHLCLMESRGECWRRRESFRLRDPEHEEAAL